MADEAYEAQIILSMADDGVGESLSEAFGDVLENIDVIKDGLNDQLDSMKQIIKNADQFLGTQEAQIRRAKALSRLYADDADMQEQAREIALEAEKAIYEQREKYGELLPRQLEDMVRLSEEAAKVQEEIEKANTTTKDWKESFDDIGMGGLVRDAAAFMTLAGQMQFWVSMFQEATRQVGLWRLENFRTYGSLTQIASQIREIRNETGLLQKDTEEAAAALMNMSVNPDNLKAYTAAVSAYTTETGASAETTAQLAKQFEAVGMDKSFPNYLQFVEGLAAKYRITGARADQMTRFMATNTRLLGNTLRAGSPEFERATTRLGMFAGAAVQAGADLEDMQSIMQSMADDVTNFAVLLGDDLSAAMDIGDPSQTFALAAGNAADALKMLEEIPPGIRNQMSKDIFGVGIKQLEEMRDMSAAVAEEEKRLQDMGIDLDTEEAKQKIAEFSEELRAANDPAYAFQQVVDDLKNIFVDVAQILIPVITAFLSFVKTLLAIPGVRPVLTILAGLALTLTVLTIAVKGILAVMGTASAAMAYFGKSAATAGQDVAKGMNEKMADGLKNFGKGIKQFFDGVAKIDLAAVFKFAVAMTILGGALILLAWASQVVDPAQLLAMSASLLMLSVAIRMMSVAINPAAVLKAALGIVILGGALFILSLALKDMTPGQMLAIGGAMMLMAVGAILLGLAGMIAGPGMIIAAVGILILSVAMLVGAAAFYVFAQALAVLQEVDLVTVALGLVAFSALALVAAVMLLPAGAIFLAAFALLAAAAVVGLIAGVLFLPAAFMIGLGMMMLFGVMALFQGSEGGLRGFAMGIAVAMGTLALGIDALTGSSYIQFMIAGGTVAAGLYPLLSTMMLFSPFGEMIKSLALALGPSLISLAIGINAITSSAYIQFAIAGGTVATGLAALLGTIAIYAIAVPAFVKLGSVAALALKGLAVGVSFLVAAPYVRFWLAAKGVAAGLGSILGELFRWRAAVSTLPIIAAVFATSMLSLAKGAEIAASFDPDPLEDFGYSFKESMEYLSDAAQYAGNVRVTAASSDKFVETIKNAKQAAVYAASVRDWDVIENAADAFHDALYYLDGAEDYVGSLKAAHGMSIMFAETFKNLKDSQAAISGLDLSKADDAAEAFMEAVEKFANAGDKLVELSKARKSAEEFRKLVDALSDVGDGKNLITVANTTNVAFNTIAKSLDMYAVKVEQAAERVSAAITKASGSAELLKLTGLEEMVKTSSIVTVKSDLEDADQRNVLTKQQVELMEQMIAALGGVKTAIDEKDVGGNVDNIEEIKKQLAVWLPQIAEQDSGLATSVNQWVQGQG